jgi:hypothetical protein
LTVLDLIDGRIAELDRLTAEAALDGGEPVGDGQELSRLLVALRALRQHKVAGASPLPRAITPPPRPPDGVARGLHK